jgi:hypothetical protein
MFEKTFTTDEIKEMCDLAIDARDQARVIRTTTSVEDVKNHRSILRDNIDNLRDLEAFFDEEKATATRKLNAVKGLRRELESKEEDLKNQYWFLHKFSPSNI